MFLVTKECKIGEWYPKNIRLLWKFLFLFQLLPFAIFVWGIILFTRQMTGFLYLWQRSYWEFLVLNQQSYIKIVCIFQLPYAYWVCCINNLLTIKDHFYLLQWTTQSEFSSISESEWRVNQLKKGFIYYPLSTFVSSI